MSNQNNGLKVNDMRKINIIVTNHNKDILQTSQQISTWNNISSAFSDDQRIRVNINYVIYIDDIRIFENFKKKYTSINLLLALKESKKFHKIKQGINSNYEYTFISDADDFISEPDFISFAKTLYFFEDYSLVKNTFYRIDSGISTEQILRKNDFSFTHANSIFSTVDLIHYINNCNYESIFAEDILRPYIVLLNNYGNGIRKFIDTNEPFYYAFRYQKKDSFSSNSNKKNGDQIFNAILLSKELGNHDMSWIGLSNDISNKFIIELSKLYWKMVYEIFEILLLNTNAQTFRFYKRIVFNNLNLKVSIIKIIFEKNKNLRETYKLLYKYKFITNNKLRKLKNEMLKKALFIEKKIERNNEKMLISFKNIEDKTIWGNGVKYENKTT